MSRDNAIALANQSFALIDEIDAALRESSAVRMAPVFERVLTNNAPLGIVEAVDWDAAPESVVRQNMSTITSVGACTCLERAVTYEIEFGDTVGHAVAFFRECDLAAPEKTLIGLIAYVNGIIRNPQNKPYKRYEEGRKNIPPHLLNDQPQIANNFLGTGNQYLFNFIREDLWDLYDIP